MRGPGKTRQLLVALFLLLGLSACASEAGDAGGTPAAGTGIQNKGSDTMVNLALAWAEAYGSLHPQVQIAVTGGGSGTGIAALVNGTVDLANASRAITADEQANALANGVQPLEHVVAADAIAIVVHPDNPVDRLTIPQLAAIFSGQIVNWQEVGGEDRPIVLLSRESNSGTHVFFLEQVLRQGRDDDDTLFSPDTLLMPSSEGITQEVRQNPNAIGYDGLGYVTPQEKVVAVATVERGAYVLPSVDTVRDGSYPIARELYIYTTGQPQGAMLDYLTWILGPEGQAIVRELGFVPLSEAVSDPLAGAEGDR